MAQGVISPLAYRAGVRGGEPVAATGLAGRRIHGHRVLPHTEMHRPGPPNRAIAAASPGLARDPDGGQRVQPGPVRPRFAALLLLFVLSLEPPRVGFREVPRRSGGDRPDAGPGLGEPGQVGGEVLSSPGRRPLRQFVDGVADRPLVPGGDPTQPVGIHRRRTRAPPGVDPRTALSLGQPQLPPQSGRCERNHIGVRT